MMHHDTITGTSQTYVIHHAIELIEEAKKSLQGVLIKTMTKSIKY